MRKVPSTEAKNERMCVCAVFGLGRFTFFVTATWTQRGRPDLLCPVYVTCSRATGVTHACDTHTPCPHARLRLGYTAGPARPFGPSAREAHPQHQTRAPLRALRSHPPFSPPPADDLLLKTLIIGDSGVGKSCILLRCVGPRVGRAKEGRRRVPLRGCPLHTPPHPLPPPPCPGLRMTRTRSRTSQPSAWTLRSARSSWTGRRSSCRLCVCRRGGESYPLSALYASPLTPHPPIPPPVGHRGAGAVPHHHLLLLPGRARHHHRVRHHGPGVV